MQVTNENQNRLYMRLSKPNAERLFEALEVALEDNGHAVSMFETAEDTGVFEVSVYAVANTTQDASGTMGSVAQALGLTAPIQVEALPDEDWVTKSLEGLQPVRVGRFLVHGSHDREHVRAGDIGIEIEAGQAFGTGHHGTTAGCIEMMDRVFRKRLAGLMIDVGTGSAVLAIAAAKGWKRSVIATDIDPVATRVARENARSNGVAALIHCETAIGFQHETVRANAPFDTIVANILAKPLMKMAPAFAQHLAAGGDIILSGILSEQRNKVLAAFRLQGLYHMQTIWREGWVTLHLRASAGR